MQDLKSEFFQNLCANLLINYIDIEKNLQQTVYLKILDDISLEEVKILEHIWNVFENNLLLGDVNAGANNYFKATLKVPSAAHSLAK